jgi:hypothetical protein
MNRFCIGLLCFFTALPLFAQGGVDLSQQKQLDNYYKSVLPGYQGQSFAIPGYGGKYTGDMTPKKITPALTIGARPTNRRSRRPTYYRYYRSPYPYQTPYAFGRSGYFIPTR